MSIRGVNLNLLPVLQVLLRERNLTRAGNLLGLTQPALSMALTRLRQTLDDPLLVRQGRQMVLTIKAQELIPAVDDICHKIEGILPLTGFDPIEYRGTWVIASSDQGFQHIAPKLVAAMEKRAPNAMLHLVDVPHHDLEPHAGEVDFFILPRQIMESGRFPNMRYEPFITEHFVAIASKETASQCRAGQKPNRIAMYYPGLASIDPKELSILNGWEGVTGRTVVQVQHFNLLPALVSTSGCAAIVPISLAKVLQQIHAFEVIEGIGATQKSMETVLAWYASQANHPHNRWLRKLILELGQA
jgi:LysR family transcriptional regulator, nod-box dependent transcriptional activator